MKREVGGAECKGVFKLQTSSLYKSIFGYSLADIDGLTDRLIEDFTIAIDRLGNTDQIRRQIDPQWVVLAAGKGSRIDPTGRLNKMLDIWFGQKNVLDLSRQHLPTTRPHIIVVNPVTYQRLISLNTNQVILCVQEEVIVRTQVRADTADLNGHGTKPWPGSPVPGFDFPEFSNP